MPPRMIWGLALNYAHKHELGPGPNLCLEGGGESQLGDGAARQWAAQVERAVVERCDLVTVIETEPGVARATEGVERRSQALEHFVGDPGPVVDHAQDEA